MKNYKLFYNIYNNVAIIIKKNVKSLSSFLNEVPITHNKC